MITSSRFLFISVPKQITTDWQYKWGDYNIRLWFFPVLTAKYNFVLQYRWFCLNVGCKERLKYMEILGILLACKLCIVKSWAIWGRLHGLYDIEILFQSLQSCASLEGRYHQMRPFEISKKSKRYTLLWPVNSGFSSQQYVPTLALGKGMGKAKSHAV